MDVSPPDAAQEVRPGGGFAGTDTLRVDVLRGGGRWTPW